MGAPFLSGRPCALDEPGRAVVCSPTQKGFRGERTMKNKVLLTTICLLLTGVMGIAQAKKLPPSRSGAAKSGAPKSGVKKPGSGDCNNPSQMLQDGSALCAPD